MSIQDQLTADQAALQVAQDAVVAAQAKVDADSAALAAAEPHLSVLSEIEAAGSALAAYQDSVVTGAWSAILALLAKARSLF